MTLTKILADLTGALDGGNFALLALSTAFDTVDHAILFARLDIIRYQRQPSYMDTVLFT